MSRVDLVVAMHCGRCCHGDSGVCDGGKGRGGGAVWSSDEHLLKYERKIMNVFILFEA